MGFFCKSTFLDTISCSWLTVSTPLFFKKTQHTKSKNSCGLFFNVHTTLSLLMVYLLIWFIRLIKISSSVRWSYWEFHASWNVRVSLKSWSTALAPAGHSDFFQFQIPLCFAFILISLVGVHVSHGWHKIKTKSHRKQQSSGLMYLGWCLFGFVWDLEYHRYEGT